MSWKHVALLTMIDPTVAANFHLAQKKKKERKDFHRIEEHVLIRFELETYFRKMCH